MTDLHTHTSFSHDGISTAEQLVQEAIKQNFKYLGLSEHLDYDCLLYPANIKQLDIDAYFTAAKALKEKYTGQITLLVGLEYGYVKNSKIIAMYANAYEKYRPDFVINSIHTAWQNKLFKTIYLDYYFAKYGKKAATYNNYLQCIYKSTTAPYYFDIIGHIGYATRYAPYEDKNITYSVFYKKINKILQSIIDNNKILEINCSKSNDNIFLPELDIIEAYYNLGGRKISYGSDAHSVKYLGNNRDKAVATLKQIGFDHLTIPLNKQHIEYTL